MSVKEIAIKDYTYELPEEKIAKFPLENRAMSKLLVYQHDQISESIFQNVGAYLPAGARLIFNSTKVVCARILFQTSTDKKVEIFMLEPSHGQEMQQAMLQKGTAKWICLVGNMKQFKENFLTKVFAFEGKEYFIKVYKPTPYLDSFKVKLEWSEELTFAEVLSFAGLIPLPPYMKRLPVAEDTSRYQTVYANEEGSVAAPTAGLHFTDELLANLNANKVDCSNVVLHVGAGTFKPVKAATMVDHQMHAEEIVVEKSLLEDIIAKQQPIVVVGTTSFRTMESLFWFGLKLELNGLKSATSLSIAQWDPYELVVPEGFTYLNAFENIVKMLQITNQHQLKGKTQLLVAPGYQVRVAEAIITNFHQPDSTLLLLVAAFVGEANWKKIYDYALSHDFRFLSFGDSSILYRG
jgi:S-adenosylmethionine:tRNA ribosyltransferase-isomerase